MNGNGSASLNRASLLLAGIGLFCFISGTAALAGAVPSGAAVLSATSPASSVESATKTAAKAGASGATDRLVISGNSTTSLWLRADDEDFDSDLYQYLTFNARNLFNNKKLSLHSLARLKWDIDGGEDLHTSYRDSYDGYFDDDLSARLYYLYLDWKDPFVENSNLRIGRQRTIEAETILFDGFRYDQRIGRQDFYIQAGNYASHWSITDWDPVAGAGFKLRPIPQTRIDFDYLHVTNNDFDNDAFSLTWRQQIYDGLSLLSRFKALDEDEKDILVKATADILNLGLTIEASYYELLDTQEEESNAFSPFFRVVGIYDRYRLFSGTVYKAVGDHLTLFAGAEVRRLADGSDQETFNREWERYFAGASLEDLPIKGLGFSLTLEQWDIEEGDDSQGVDFEISHQCNKALRAAIGFAYAAFDYETNFDPAFDPTLPVEFEIQEEVDVWTAYATVKYAIGERQRLNFRVEGETETGDIGDSMSVRMRYEIDF